MPYALEQLVTKYETARTNHIKWLQSYWEAFLYITPQRDCLNQIMQYFDQGLINTYQIYNTTAPNAAISRANKLVRMLMPDNQRWGQLEASPHELQKTDLTPDDIALAESTLYSYIRQSNLSQQTQDAFVDESIGAGALWIENPTLDEPIKLQAVPGFAVMPEFYSGNQVRDLWYPWSASGQYLLDNYPNLGTALKALITASPNDIYWVIRGVVYDPKDNRPEAVWRVVDLVPGVNQGPYDIVYEDWFTYKKLIYFRDRVRPGETAGRGPGIEYLPTIRRLNELCRLSDESDEIRAFPPTEVDETKVNLDLLTDFSGSSVPRGTFGQSLSLPPAPEVQEKIQKMELDIQKGFSVDPLGGLNQPVRTAAEIGQRVDSALENTTIDVSRILQESSKPLFETFFAILLELGLIPNTAKFKKALANNKQVLLFKYQNPLGDIEKHNNMVGLAGFFQFSQQYLGEGMWQMQVNPAAIQNFMIANATVPSNLFVSGNAMVDNMQKAQKMAQDAQNQAGGQGPAANAPQPTTAAAKPQPLTPEGVTL
jgi:Bacteriophage head to tail connecting protein